MGPNGSGKSTLSYVLAGRDGYEVTGGDILMNGEDLLEMEPDERARAGMFLAFQYPVEIPGVANMSSCARRSTRCASRPASRNSTHGLRQDCPRAKVKLLGISDEMLKRAVNVGFSGGEKKRTRCCRWRCSSRSSRFSTNRTPASMSTRSVVADGVNKLRSPGAGDARHHPLSAAAGIHRAGRRARPGAGGKIRKSGRQGHQGTRTGGPRAMPNSMTRRFG